MYHFPVFLYRFLDCSVFLFLTWKAFVWFVFSRNIYINRKIMRRIFVVTKTIQKLVSVSNSHSLFTKAWWFILKGQGLGRPQNKRLWNNLNFFFTSYYHVYIPTVSFRSERTVAYNSIYIIKIPPPSAGYWYKNLLWYLRSSQRDF